MKIKEFFFAFIILLLVLIIFFYKFFLYGLVPFPGDNLVANYAPFKTYSYLGYNPGTFPNKAQYFDTLRQIYPWRTFSIDILRRGEIPLWNPYNFSGSPLLANFQSAVFYPLNIFYLFLSQVNAWSFLVILQPLLVGIFTYLFARKIGISKEGSLFSAISFAFSSFLTVWLEYNTIGQVILWLPLTLLSIEQLLEKRQKVWIIIFIFSLVSSLFGGHPQIFAYLALFALIFLIYRLKTLSSSLDKRKSLLVFIFLFIISLGIGAVQLIPGIELLNQSARSPYEYDFLIHKILIQPWQLIMLFVPDFFGNPATHNYWPLDTYVGKVTSIGLISLFFVLLTILRKKNTLTWFFLITSGIVLLLVTLNPITLLFYKIQIPLITSSAPTLMIFILCFSLSILSGYGIDIWQKEKMNFRMFLFFFLPIVFLFIFFWIVLFFLPKPHLTIAFRNLLYTTVILSAALLLLVIRNLRARAIFLIFILLFLLQTADLFHSFEKFNPFSPREFIFPQISVFNFLKKEAGINRVWGYGNAFIEANFETQYSLFSPNGYDPLYPKRYGEFIQSSRDGKINQFFTNQTRSDAVLAPSFSENDFSSNTYRLKVLDVLGVKYVLDRRENGASEKAFPIDRFRLVYENDGWKIFENKKAVPRAFLTSDYRVFKDKDDFVRIFYSEEFNPSKTILLEDDFSAKLDDTRHLSEAKIVSYTPNKIVIQTNTDGRKILFLSDTYYPGWKATVDGEETEIYRADYTFRAVVAPKGKHSVVFTFEPLSFKIGLTVSLLAIFLTMISLKYFKE